MNYKFNLIALLVFLTCFSMSSFSQTIEKLDSIVNTSAVSGAVNNKNIYGYNELAKDTLSEFLINTNGVLETFTRVRTFFNPNETIIESYLASIDALSRRDVITLDANGDEVERVIETYSFVTSEFGVSSKEVITNDSPSLLEIDIFAWTGTEFLLNQKREIAYQPSGSFTTTTSQYLGNGTLIPIQRQITEFDETTGVRTLLRFENYDQNTEMWFTTILFETALNMADFSGVEIRSTLQAGKTDSVLISYNADWLAQERTTYQFDENDNAFLQRREELDYTASKNLLENRIFNYVNGNEQASSTSRYYYTTVVISSISEIEATPFPVELLYKNPATGDGTILLQGDNSNPAQFNFQLFNANGQLILREKVRTGERVNLNNSNLSAGIYFMTLQKEGQLKTWKLVIE